MRVAGILVAYETPPGEIRAAIERLSPQLHRLYILDNGTDPDILARVVGESEKENVAHLWMGGNRGIAYAQNVGIERAQADGVDFLLFLDDDSVFPVGGIAALVEEFVKLAASKKQLVGVGPRVIDERSGEAIVSVWDGNKIVPATASGPVEAAFLVSSGALIKADAFTLFGALRSDYFIDHVDKEWGLRVGRNGGSFVVTPRVVLMHRLGDEPTKTRTGATRYRHQSPMRDYYLTRNAFLMIRDARLGVRKSTRLAELVLKTAVRKLTDRSLSRPQRRAVLLGVRDGLLGRRGPRWTL